MRPLLVLLVRGQRIDRRVLYLLLAATVALPMVIRLPVPPVAITPQSRQFFRTVEQFADDPARRHKLVILCTNYGSGTSAENQTQTEAVLHHLMRKRLKFALFAFSTPQGRELGKASAEKLASRYGYEYGRDYVHFGFRPPDSVEPLLKAAVRDIPGNFGNDINGTPLAEIPVMQGIRTVNDIGMIVEVASSNTLQLWIAFFQRVGEEPIPTLYCPTNVMAPEAFPLLASGQLSGMLAGLNGATEYEQLLNEPGFGSGVSAPLSYSQLLIVLLIALGNAGMFAQRRLARLREEE
ncbi:MAG: hypothetical protein SFU56_17180 [Capsulimonadales bacterium]|nr:hypothetical protein [Capsulimonadales bacterium]